MTVAGIMAAATGSPATSRINGRPSLSVDGRHAGWLSSGASGQQLVVLDLDSELPPRRISAPSGRCGAFSWTSRPGQGVALTDLDGSENWQLHSLSMTDESWTAHPVAQAQSRLCGFSARYPDEVLVSVNDRDQRLHDYYLLSLATGQRRLVLRDPGYAAVYFDREFRPRLIETVADSGARQLWRGDPEDARLFLRIDPDAAMLARFIDFAGDGESCYLVLPDGAEGCRLVRRWLTDDRPEQLIYVADHADIVGVFFDDAGTSVELVQLEHERTECIALQPSLQAPVRSLAQRLGRQPTVLQRVNGARRWLISTRDPTEPEHYYCYDLDSGTLDQVSSRRPDVGRAGLACRPVSVLSRDGFTIPSYLSVPSTPEPGPRPAVLLVHGGPWRRTGWEYSQRRAQLVERGYLVIEPNYRGSTGFGTGWLNAADRQWGKAMQHDLEDSLGWAIEHGLADPERIALIGGSYGGYAVLQLAASSELALRCVVATAPLTDLVEFVQSPPRYWQSAQPMLRQRIGDPADPAQRAQLLASSPLANAASIRCPVLLVHGANDSRVPARMSSELFLALVSADKDVALAVFPGEGHEIVAAANRHAYESLIWRYLSIQFTERMLALEPAAPESSMRILLSPRAERYRAEPVHSGGGQ